MSGGDSGHAEAVQIVYDPAQVTYGQILQVFFSVAHDPTQLNRQGPDTGTQYRSAIFYTNDDAEEDRGQPTSRSSTRPVRIRSASSRAWIRCNGFYEAEAYHQDYLLNHPTNPYIVDQRSAEGAQLSAPVAGAVRREAGDRERVEARGRAGGRHAARRTCG